MGEAIGWSAAAGLAEGSGDLPLRGLRVIDLGQYLAGPMAAVLLADQGAEVVRIDPPGGPRWETPANVALLRRRTTLQRDLHDPGRRDEVLSLIDQADVLIENFRPGVTDRLGLGADVCLRRNPRLVYCSLPGFGSGDPRADLPGWEGVVLAAAGAFTTGSAEMLQGEWWPTDGPAFSPLLLASVFAGMQGAMGVMAALIARWRDGEGQRVEVPLHDAFFEAIGARALSYERNAPVGSTLGSGVYRCSDGGHVSLITVSFRHLVWFVEAAGASDWIDDGTVDYDRLRTRPEAAQELSRRLVDLLATRPAREWEEIGRRAGVPIGALRTAKEWMQEPHAMVAGLLRDEHDPRLGSVRVPGPAVRISTRDGVASTGADRAGDQAAPSGSAPPLQGLKVLDLSRVLAAPSASRLLAELGADVVKADADLTDAGWALRQPAFHEQTDRGKRTVVVDLAAPGGRDRLERLLTWADVLVTNFSLERLPAMGLDEETVRALSPETVFVYLNAFGTSGPWAHLRGYAEIANTVTGITERTSGEGPPSGSAPTIDLPRCPFTDYAAGILAAFGALVGWYRRVETGDHSRVETSLAATACWQQLPYMVHHDGKVWDEPRPPDVGWNDGHRLFRTAEGWVFTGMDSAQLRAVADGFGVDPGDPTTLASRLGERLARIPTEECTGRIRAVDGSVHEVVTLDELFAAGGWADRLGLRLVGRSDEFGEIVQPGPTVRLARTPMVAGRLPAPFGADDDEVWAEVEAGG